MVTSVGGVAIEIRGDNVHFLRELRESERQAGRTGQTMAREFRGADAAATKLNTTLRSTAGSIAAMAAALGAGVGLSAGIRTLADFSQGMSTVKAITQATDAQFAALEDTAKRLGGTTRFSASQASEAMLALARAGFSVDQILGSIDGTLQLAQAGAIDLGTAADIASNILTGFRLEVDQTNRVVDLMAFLANSANTDIQQLGDAMKFVAPVAAGLGVSIEEAAAAIGALSDAGLQGSLAGTGLRRVLSELESPSSKSAKIFAELGVSVADVRPSVVGLIPALQRLADAGLDTGQALEVFGDRGGPAFAVLADSLPKVIAQTKALDSAGGTAKRVAQIMDGNLNGAILGVLSAFEALTLELGKAGATDALTASFKGLADLLRFAARNADILGVAIVALATRAVLPFAFSVGGAAVLAVKKLQAELVVLSAIAGKTTTALNLAAASAGRVAVALGPLTLAIAGVAAAYIAFGRDAQTAADRMQRVNAGIEKTRALLAETQFLLTGSDSPMQQIANQADGAARQVASLTGVIDQLSTGLRNLREESRIATAFQISQDLAELNAQIRELERAREQTIGRAASLRSEDPVTARARAATRFDEGEQGRALLERRQQRAALEQRLRLATQGVSISDVIEQFRNGTPQAAAAMEQLEDAAVGTAEALADAEQANLAILASLERQQALDLARAQGNKELVDILLEQQTIIDRTLDYMEALSFIEDEGLRRAEAQKRAEADILALRQARAVFAEQEAEAERERALALAAYEEFYLRREEQKKIDDEAARAEEVMRQKIADGIARGLEDGIRSGDWGEAFRGIVASSLSSALSEAINNLAGELLTLFRSVLGGGSFGSIFGGSRAGGGSVRAGLRYIVGENGPEMFVPTVPGMIVPKFEGPASAAAGGVMGMGALNVSAPLIVQGSITEDVLPRVQAMMVAQARELPRIIDARVSDSIRRNRY
jgi:TP901 family phage tail tape measure protein